MEDVKERRWRWFGHVLRKNKNRHPRAALRWTPPGERKRGRPLGTWRRTIEEEMKAAGKTWNEVSLPYAPPGAKRIDDDDDSVEIYL